MGKAVEACVNEGMSIRQAAFHFGDRMSGRVVPGSTSGPKPIYLRRRRQKESSDRGVRCVTVCVCSPTHADHEYQYSV